MGIIILLVLLVLLVVGLFVASHKTRKAASQPQSARMQIQLAQTAKGLRIGGYVAVGLLALTLFVTSYNPVGTRNIGVVTAFGSTQGHLSNGLHLTWPWQSVTEMDAAVQTDTYNGSGCIDVRIANQQTACVDVTERWQIRAQAADSLFQSYHTFDHVRNSLVTRELVNAINTQFADYNPFNTLQNGGVQSDALNGLAVRVTNQMRSEIGGDITILNTIITFIRYDNATQARLNQLQQQIAATLIASQEQKTNNAQAIANRDLAASVNTSPNVLVAQCMNTLQQMVKDGQSVPPGFSCWPGGSGTPVIANASGKP